MYQHCIYVKGMQIAAHLPEAVKQDLLTLTHRGALQRTRQVRAKRLCFATRGHSAPGQPDAAPALTFSARWTAGEFHHPHSHALLLIDC